MVLRGVVSLPAGCHRPATAPLPQRLQLPPFFLRANQGSASLVWPATLSVTRCALSQCGGAVVCWRYGCSEVQLWHHAGGVMPPVVASVVLVVVLCCGSFWHLCGHLARAVDVWCRVCKRGRWCCLPERGGAWRTVCAVYAAGQWPCPPSQVITCSGQGTCNMQTGGCECNPAFLGLSCSLPARVHPPQWGFHCVGTVALAFGM